MDIDITAIITTLLGTTPSIGLAVIMWIHIHKTFNKYQDNLTRQHETDIKIIKDAYHDANAANKDILEKYNKFIELQSKSIDERDKTIAKLQTLINHYHSKPKPRNKPR